MIYNFPGITNGSLIIGNITIRIKDHEGDVDTNNSIVMESVLKINATPVSKTVTKKLKDTSKNVAKRKDYK